MKNNNKSTDMKRKRVIFFKLPISNVNNLFCQEAYNLGGFSNAQMTIDLRRH